MDVVFDMETGDPDDLFTLFLLCDHPKVNLRAVSITPGTFDQYSLVCWALNQFDLRLPIGVYKMNMEKHSVSSWYHKTYSLTFDDGIDVGAKCRFNWKSGGEIIAKYADENTTLITGAPLKNLDLAMDLDFKPKAWFAQGGFAGQGVVPEILQLEKFKGMATCPTFNLNGAPKTAIRALQYGNFPKYFISKNVCHGVYYDREMHEIVGAKKNTKLSLSLIHKGMEKYLRKHPAGKKFHDPLAACCAINPDIGVWREVELYREQGKWGSRFSNKPNAHIIVDYDREMFLETLLESK